MKKNNILGNQVDKEGVGKLRHRYQSIFEFQATLINFLNSLPEVQSKAERTLERLEEDL
jgi:hypothetical protein